MKRLAGYKVTVHTETDPEYDYLESEFDFVVEIANPNQGGKLATPEIVSGSPPK